MTETVDNLAIAVRRIVKKGNFTHLSLTCSDGETFKASFRGVDGPDYRHGENTDPTEALLEALTGRRTKVEKPRRAARKAPVVAKAEVFEDLLG